MTDKENTFNQILKMIASGEIPKEVYNKYLSDCEIGFMNYDDLKSYFDEEISKSAREMFEEIGYKIDVNCLGIIRYAKHNDDIDYYIRFHNDDKEFSSNIIVENKKELLYIDKKLLQAINKQIEELGWEY